MWMPLIPVRGRVAAAVRFVCGKRHRLAEEDCTALVAKTSSRVREPMAQALLSGAGAA